MHTDRLLLLADRLDEFEPAKFNICTYYSANECGTICCALGLATTMPEFEELGLERTHGGVPLYEGYVALGAARLLFGLDIKEAGDLFLPYGYAASPNLPTPKEVAAKIRRLVARHTEVEQPFVAMKTES